MIFPDYAFGHDHRDFFSAAMKAQGGEVVDADPDPADGKLLHPLLPADPGRHRGALSRHGRAGGADLRQGARRAFSAPTGRRFSASSTRSRPSPLASPGLEFLEGTYFWEAYPRYAGADQTEFDKFYREKVGVDANGASASDPNDISTYSHMFGCWETLYVIKQAMEASGYQVRDRRRQGEADRGDRGDDGLRRKQRAPAGRQDLQRQDPPVLSATRTSRRSRAASSTSCTAPRSRTGSTSRRRTTRRWRFESGRAGGLRFAVVIPVCRASGETGTPTNTDCRNTRRSVVNANLASAVFMGPGQALRAFRDDIGQGVAR